MVKADAALVTLLSMQGLAVNHGGLISTGAVWDLGMDVLPEALCSRRELSWGLQSLAVLGRIQSIRASQGWAQVYFCIWDQSLKYQLAFLSLLTFLKHLNNFFFSSVKINHFKLYVNLINKDRLQNATRNDFFFLKFFNYLGQKMLQYLTFHLVT